LREEVVMSAQHAPQKPLWRRVISLPQTRLGWWAVGLSGISLVLMPFTADAPILIITTIVSGLFGGVVALGAMVGTRERSWLVWLALVPVLIFLSVFVLFISAPLTGWPQVR